MLPYLLSALGLVLIACLSVSGLTINELKWSALTAAINEVKSPGRFLQDLIFGNHVTLPTETVEYGTWTGKRLAAPFVRKNGEAVNVTGRGQTFATVEAPNIRIKRPFTPSELLFGRKPGVTIFPSKGEVVSAVQQHIAGDVAFMGDMITNATEWLCAMAIRGTITYSVSDQEVFTITLPKPAGNTITLSTFWDSGTTDNPHNEFQTAKDLIDAACSLNPTIAIFGSEAAAVFVKHSKVLSSINTQANQGAGALALMSQIAQDGTQYLGIFDGIPCYKYSRQVDVGGVDTDLIRPKYVEFLAVTPAAENVLYFGAIPDIDAFEGGLFQGERFSKSWKQADPSVLMHLAHSRPLPVLRRPGSSVSIKVVSG